MKVSFQTRNRIVQEIKDEATKDIAWMGGTAKLARLQPEELEKMILHYVESAAVRTMERL